MKQMGLQPLATCTLEVDESKFPGGDRVSKRNKVLKVCRSVTVKNNVHKSGHCEQYSVINRKPVELVQCR